MKNTTAETYDHVDPKQLAALCIQHAWIVEPIYHASDLALEMPFFSWLSQIQSPIEFKPAAVQLYYHSATFPKVMGLMLALGAMSENSMMPFYAKHPYGEADHHAMLMEWMLKHGLLSSPSEIETVIPPIETNACVNYTYQIAIEQDRDKWLVGLNSGIERCSNDFFKVVSPKLHAIGAGDLYFDIHVEADEFHSIMGLEYIHSHSSDSFRGRQLITKALERISLWAAILHSWIGIELFPKFDLNGDLIIAEKQNN